MLSGQLYQMSHYRLCFSMLKVGDDNFTTLCCVQLSKEFYGCKLGHIHVKKGDREHDRKRENQRKKRYTAEFQIRLVCQYYRNGQWQAQWPRWVPEMQNLASSDIAYLDIVSSSKFWPSDLQLTCSQRFAILNDGLGVTADKWQVKYSTAVI